MNIREHLDVCCGGVHYFSNECGGRGMILLTEMPKGRWVSICDFKGCLCLSVFVLSP